MILPKMTVLSVVKRLSLLFDFLSNLLNKLTKDRANF